jgi:hypothetical protein
MNININVAQADISVQLIDALYAYVQSNIDERTTNWVISTTDFYDSTADINLAWTSQAADIDNIAKYNAVFIGNAGEPITVSSPFIQKVWEYDNVFLVFNSLVTSDHLLYDKVVHFPDDVQLCRDYWTRYFYPQYYTNNYKLKKLDRTKNLVAINGLNRTVRHHFFNQLGQKTNIPVLNNLSKQITNTNHSYWESLEDFEFRDALEQQYADVFELESDYIYYENYVTMGINGKFGQALPGYNLTTEYFEYRCVIFPEATWQNNELSITEKATKCFYAGSLPFPIAGANVNALYNSLGYYTAWNLLPKELQVFDSELDHFKRCEQILNALQWLESNTKVFEGEQFDKFIRQNKINMLTYSPIDNGIQKLIEVINERRCRH